MTLYTIGFTKTSAEHFFTRLQQAGVRQLIDVRLHNVSQLAGFAKKDDLAYFLRTIADIDYIHETALAPEAPMLAAYRGRKMSWAEYEDAYRALLHDRKAQEALSAAQLADACLLCSEATATLCHRRLAAEYFQQYSPNLSVIHL